MRNDAAEMLKDGLCWNCNEYVAKNTKRNNAIAAVPKLFALVERVIDRGDGAGAGDPVIGPLLDELRALLR